MEQEQRKSRFKIWLAILIVVLILLALLIWWLTRKQPLFGPGPDNVPVYETPSANVTYEPPTADVVDNEELQITVLARMFTERFGSWSTDNQLKNLEELLSLSTASMQSYLNQQERTQSDQFYGVTTKALSTNVTSQSDSSAEVIVSTQRIENKEGQQNIFYQDLRITMVNSQGNWLVSGAYWQ